MTDQNSSMNDVHLAAPSGDVPDGVHSGDSGVSAPRAEGSVLRDALDFDPLHAASVLTGVSYKESRDTEWLGFALMQEQRKVKNTLLAANRDTNSWNQTLAEWMAVVEDLGFRLLHTEDIPGAGDKQRIWWRDGILLNCDSYRGDQVVNSATAYFQYQGPRNAMHKCSSGFSCDIDGQPVWDGSRDAREGLRFALDRMAAEGRFLPKWPRVRFLWLLHYGDTKSKNYDYEAITAARLAKLPADVREAITGAERSASGALPSDLSTVNPASKASEPDEQTSSGESSE